MIAKVSFSFTRLADAKLIIKTDQIIDSMTGNPAFPTPAPTLASVQTSGTAFQNALADAADGGKSKTAAKNAAREVLVGKLRDLALYVQIECDNDLAVLLSSGFDAQSSPTPAGVLPAPTGVTLTQGTLSGQLDLRADAVSNAGSYEAQVTQDLSDGGEWRGVGSGTAPRMTIGGLTRATNYWVRLRAIGSKGPGAWSPLVSAIAL